MTRPILHRQVIWAFDDETECLEDMGLYASLAAVTLPPKGGAIAFGTVATREPSRQSALPSRPDGRVSTIAIDALMWAVFAGCFVLLASGAL